MYDICVYIPAQPITFKNKGRAWKPEVSIANTRYSKTSLPGFRFVRFCSALRPLQSPSVAAASWSMRALDFKVPG